MIGFVAGVIGALTPKVFEAKTISGDLLVYLASVGYVGVDIIEAFAQTIVKGKVTPPADGDGGDGSQANRESRGNRRPSRRIPRRIPSSFSKARRQKSWRIS